MAETGRSGAAGLVTRRVLGGAAQLAQLWFDAAVLQKYRESGGRVLRTSSMGRVKLAAWSLDFGIASDALIHVSAGEAQARIPAGEREHWAAHAVTPALSLNYVTVQVTHGTCVDDGDLRDW
jgi:hypothetical protein